ncbi:MAG: thiol peroxidase [Candidatus Omnitrophota bacterium]
MGYQITIKGDPVVLSGEEVKVGQKAPDFKVVDAELKEVGSEAFKGKVKLIASVPSLDTPICDLQIKRFNDEAAGLSKDVVIIFVSMDLPFAQKRFCQAYNIKGVKTFSDHKTGDFGSKYGVLIESLRLLSRALFLIDKDDVVRYVEYVKELTSHPDYDSALKALKEIS